MKPFLLLFLITLMSCGGKSDSVPKNNTTPPDGSNTPPAVLTTYTQDIAPLMGFCNSCHGAALAAGTTYRTDSYASLLGPSTDGLTSVIPGDPSSRLVRYTSIAFNHESANTAVPGIAAKILDWVMDGALLDSSAQSIVTNVSSLTVNESGNATLTAKFFINPAATSATISVTLSNTGPAAVSPQSLTFTSSNFSTPQTITITGIQDTNTLSESIVLTLSGLGIPSKQVAVTVVDDDTSPPPGTNPPPAATSQVFVGVGNIGNCGANIAASGTLASGLLLDTQMKANPAATVFTVGDNQYNSGSPTEFADCYDKTAWGTYKGNTRAVMGDHDTKTIVNGGYYAYTYFGPNSGTPAQHWYSYDLGAWHIIVLDSNVTSSLGSAQNTWLRSDLAANTKSCTMALFHHPYFSAGGINTAGTKPMWDALYEFGADVIFSAHVHAYQRLAPMKPDGTLDPTFGIRSFVVGTGGATLANLPAATPVTEIQNSGTYGIVKFDLSDNAYNWQFIPVAGKTFTDSGSGVCHNAPSNAPGSPPTTLVPTTTTTTLVPATTTTTQVPATTTTLAPTTTTTNAPKTTTTTLVPATTTTTAQSPTTTSTTPTTTTTTLTPPPVTTSQVFVGVGNIGNCGANIAASGTLASGLLLDTQMKANPAATVFTVGDNQYNSGSPTEFADCYDKTAWGTYKGKTRAVMGDHDTKTIVNGGYYAYTYFGPNSGTPAQHWYSYDLGAWHIIVLDSNVTSSLGSAQNTWLRSDLAANTKSCTMALFHHPYFSAGGINTAGTKPMWDALYEFGADVIFSAHVHAYQRLAPMRPDGTLDPLFGIRSFVVGTGGATLATLPAASPVTEIQNSGTFGIVKFNLSDNAYNWQFIPVAGKTFTDSGSGVCHNAPL